MRILLVEDERRVADFINRGLQEALHVLDVASSIADADDFIAIQSYDLLIVDCMLPDGDGREFCRNLRARGFAAPIADLTIDPLRRRVTRAGKTIRLTPKEYRVLELLVTHAETVLTRTEIIQRVWDIDFDPSSNIVDAVIRGLREKIDRDFVPKLIHTVRGLGYVMSTTP